MTSRYSIRMRRAVAAGLCAIYPASMGWAQQSGIAPVPSPMPAIVRPYFAPEVPPVRVANSARLGELVRAGSLYLTVQDAIALALENSIDLEVARYNPLIASWAVTRSEAGGALPGVPSNASQAGSVALGQGVTGSQAAAGVNIPGSGSNRTQSTNATVSQIGPVTQTLDPSIQEASTFSHTTTPQPNAVQSITPFLVASTRAHTLSFQEGFLSGGLAVVRYTENYLNENSPSDILNPSSAPTLMIGVQHNLLRGFGVAVNARTITVSKMNVHISDLSFETQVIGVVNQVLTNYYGLAADYEDVRAKRNALDVERTFYRNVKEQVSLGSLAPPDLDNAEAQMVSSERALVDSQATLDQQEDALKALLSRNGTGDPLMRDARIVPVDRIVIPDQENLPPVAELVKQAMANRSDLAGEKESEAASQVSTLGTKNGIRPSLQVFALESQAGLAGTPTPATGAGGSGGPDPYFVGGLGKALGQVFRRNFPTEQAGAFYVAPLRNNLALSDYAIDQLQLRQTQLTTRKDVNQVEVDVMNYMIALRQARARYQAAVKNSELQQRLFEAEQKRFKLGTSVPYNVIQQQRDLIAAQAVEVSALVSYSTARIGLDRSLGTTLSANHVSLDEARTGKVSRPSRLPEHLPQQP